MNAQKTNRQEELPRILIGIDTEVHDWLDGKERWRKGDWILLLFTTALPNLNVF